MCKVCYNSRVVSEENYLISSFLFQIIGDPLGFWQAKLVYETLESCLGHRVSETSMKI